ncbi:MAG TPA: murein biosynthesis integral membrane protein MurJ [Ktedonobacterales bacterium]|nr:murein biosynthesis integral membrane protein MurJ [Ktedonobacterales bacterium]
MDRRRDAADAEYARQRAMAEQQRTPLWPAEPTRDAHESGERGANPPWEQESGRYPVPSEPLNGNDDWPWDPAVEQSLPGASINDMNATGRFSAVVPLSPNDSAWSKGVRAPRKGARRGPAVDVASGDVEVDDQPSVQMRAMRAGNLARATLIVTSALLISRILGLGRTSLFTYTFGVSAQTDAFTNAFALPDMLFNIVAGGALASAFIPIFTDYLVDKRDKKTAWHVASSALNLSMLLLTMFGILGFIFAQQFMELTLPVFFRPGDPRGPLTVEYTRLMLLQPIFLGGATIAIAILQSRQHFVLPALGQVIYTVSLIGGILVALVGLKTGFFDQNTAMYGPIWGVVLGAVLQFVIQIPGLARAKMQYKPSFDFFHPGITRMFKLMLPRILNSAFIFISLYINRNLIALGSNNNEGAVTGYVIAFQLVLLPLGVFGMAVSQAAFPTLAALVSAGEWERLRETILRTVRGVIFLALPSSLGLIVLADPLVRLLLAHGSLALNDIPLFTQPLIFFSVGLLGLALVEVLTRCFYALHDTRTATEVSILQFLFVIAMSVILLKPMGAGGLALATSLGSMGEALVLLLLLKPRLGGLDLRALRTYTFNVAAASVVCALAALFTYMLVRVVLPVQPTSVRETVYLAIGVSAAILVATGVYFAFSRFLGTDDVVSVGRILKRVLRR